MSGVTLEYLTGAFEIALKNEYTRTGDGCSDGSVESGEAVDHLTGDAGIAESPEGYIGISDIVEIAYLDELVGIRHGRRE